MTKISAIVPVGNQPKYPAECLDSILSQTFQDFEIICVYYGSNDCDIKLLDKYSQYDNRIRVIEAPGKNRAGAKNIGLENAGGKYLCFIEPDDSIHEEMFVKVFENFLQFDSEFVFTKMLRYNPADENYYETNSDYLSAFENKYSVISFRESELDADAFFNLPCTMRGKFFTNEFIIKNSLRFVEDVCFEDNVFFAQAFFNAQRITYLNEFLYVSPVIMKQQESIKENSLDTLKVFQLVRETVSKNSLYEKYKTKLLISEMKTLMYHLSNTPFHKKKEYFEAIKENYSDFRTDELDLKELEQTEVFPSFVKLLQCSYEEYERIFEGVSR